MGLTPSTFKDPVKLLKAGDAASLLGISKQRLYELCRRNYFPAGVVVRFGNRQIRFNQDKLIEWIEAGGYGSRNSETGGEK